MLDDSDLSLAMNAKYTSTYNSVKTAAADVLCIMFVAIITIITIIYMYRWINAYMWHRRQGKNLPCIHRGNTNATIAVKRNDIAILKTMPW